MDLRDLLKLCQYGDHAHEWVRVPPGPGERLLTGFIDVASSNEPPALAALQANYNAVYIPDPSLTIAWGFPFEDWRERRLAERVREDWQPESFKSVDRQAAAVLYNGALVWQVTYAYADWGSGIGMPVPWPSREYAAGGDRDQPTFWVTAWEVEFAYLLANVQREQEMDLVAHMTANGVQVRNIDPITVQQEGL